MVSFQPMNLLQPFARLGTFDIVFCRNVAIYFTPDTRRDLFERITDVLSPDGCLFVGSSESLLDFGSRFRSDSHGRTRYYCPNLDPVSIH